MSFFVFVVNFFFSSSSSGFFSTGALLDKVAEKTETNSAFPQQSTLYIPAPTRDWNYALSSQWGDEDKLNSETHEPARGLSSSSESARKKKEKRVHALSKEKLRRAFASTGGPILL